VDGVIGEASYYNSGGTSSNEFWQVDLASSNCAFAANAGNPQQIYNVTFINRNPMTPTCWTAPASWTAAGIANTCNTRAINQTLSVLDDRNNTIASMLLTSYLQQSMLLRCTPSPTPAQTSSPTSTGTAMTASVSSSWSGSQTANASTSPSASRCTASERSG
jgi:hypothetical protein